MKKIIIRFNAPVILSFALLSLIALLLGNWTNGAATTQYFSVYRSSLADPLTYVRFFGHVLGHSGYDHYMGNMLLLLLVGPGLEEKYGSGTMVWMIALTALVTGLVNFIFFPHTALLGASGVVFMMIVLSSFTAARKGEIPVTLILVVIFYLGGEIMDGLLHSHRHCGGAVCRRPDIEISVPDGEAEMGRPVCAPDPSGEPGVLSGAGTEAREAAALAAAGRMAGGGSVSAAGAG